MARRPTVWHLEDIKAALRKRHGSLRGLSRAWGFGDRAVSKVLTDPRYSRALEKRIAADLRVNLHVLWPDRWCPRGKPLPRSGGDIVTPGERLESCQKGEAA